MWGRSERMRTRQGVTELVERMLAGDTRALPRLISLVEGESEVVADTRTWYVAPWATLISDPAASRPVSFSVPALMIVPAL